MNDTLTGCIQKLRLQLADLDEALPHLTDEQLTQCLREALVRVSHVSPRLGQTVLPIVAGSRELSLSSLQESAMPCEVYFPYECDVPLQLVPWERLGDILILNVDRPPADYENVMVRYTLPHTISDLDGATESTLSAAEEQALFACAQHHALRILIFSSVNEATINNAMDFYAKLLRPVHLHADVQLCELEHAAQGRISSVVAWHQDV